MSEFTEFPIKRKRASEVGDALRAAIDAPRKERYNVLDYGAIGDGTTDSTTAINEAIQAAHEAGGGEVFFPPGDYLISRSAASAVDPYWSEYTAEGGAGSLPALLLLQGVDLIGSGASNTKITLSTSDPAAHVKCFEATDFRVSGIHFFGNRVNMDFISGEVECLDFKKGCARFTVSHCKFEAIQNEAIDLDVRAEDVARLEEDGVHNIIHDCVFEFVGGTGIHNALWTVVERCVFRNVGMARLAGSIAGLPGTSGQGAIDGSGIALRVRDCYAEDCARLLHIYSNPVGAGSRQVSKTVVENCYVVNSAAGDVEGTSSSFALIRDSVFAGPAPSVANSFMDGVELIADGSITDLPNLPVNGGMVNCVIVGRGITIGSQAAGMIVSGCLIDCSSRTTSVSVISLIGNGLNDVVIHSCRLIQNATATAPILGTNTDVEQRRNRITNNRISGSCNHYIRVGSDSVVSGNICSGGGMNGITVKNNRNIITGNVMDRPVVEISGATDNVIADNIVT